MPKKIPITFLFTMVFAIVALFAATQVLAEEHPPINQTGSYFEFQPPESGATTRSVYYEMNPAENKIRKLIVNGVIWSPNDPRIYHLDEDFRFCIRCLKDTPPADCVTIGTEKFKCYVPKWVSNEAAFISNPSCPIFLNPPGIFIDPCK